MKLLSFLLLSLFVMSVTITAVEITQDETTPQILIIHSNSTEKVSILSAFEETPISIDIETTLNSNLTDINFLSYDMIVFVSSNEFSLEENVENRLMTFLQDPSKFFIIFTPYLDEFEDTLETLLGIENIGDSYDDDGNITTWDLQLDQGFGNLSNGDTFTYSGEFTEFEPLLTTSTIASVIDSDNEDEISFPQPAIINATTNKAHIITSSLSPYSTEVVSLLSLTQIPYLFDVLLQQIFLSSVIIIDQSIELPIISSAITSISDKPDENAPIDNFPIIPDLPFGNFLLYGIIILFSLLITKILGILDWLSRKVIGIGILFIGAFYSVEDRILDPKDVYLNQSRVEIMDFLDTVGKYGSHIREIKSITNLGSGSLMWHLKVLEDFNWIVKYKIENYTVYVSYDFETTFDPYVKGLELKIQSKYTSDLLHALLGINFDTNIVITDLQELTSVPNKAIRRFINKLAELDLIKISSQKPIKFRIYNYSILNNLNESFQLRKYYEITNDSGVQVEELD